MSMFIDLPVIIVLHGIGLNKFEFEFELSLVVGSRITKHLNKELRNLVV